MVVLGGMGNIWGVAVGAFVIYTIQVVFLKQLNTFFGELGVPILKDLNFLQYQFLLYGIALVLMMLFRPEGLFPADAGGASFTSQDDSDGASSSRRAPCVCRPRNDDAASPTRRARADRGGDRTLLPAERHQAVRRPRRGPRRRLRRSRRARS